LYKTNSSSESADRFESGINRSVCSNDQTKYNNRQVHIKLQYTRHNSNAIANIISFEAI